MKTSPETTPFLPLDYTAIRTEAQRLRAQAMAELLRSFRADIARGWAARMRPKGRMAH